MANDHGGDSGFFKGVLFGGIMGAIAALLFAPKTGREMREDICRRSSDLRDDIEQKLELAVKKAEEILTESKGKLENFRNGAQELEGTSASGYIAGKETLKDEKGRLKEAIHAGVAAYKDEKESRN